MGFWQRLKSWFEEDERQADGSAASVRVEGLREAAAEIAVVAGELGTDETPENAQARLYVASGQMLRRVADALSAGSNHVDSRGVEHAASMYREVLRLVDRARAAASRPPAMIEPIKSPALILTHVLPSAQETTLLNLVDEFDRAYATDIEYARVSRPPAELARLNELLSYIDSRTNTAHSLFGAAQSGGSDVVTKTLIAQTFSEVLMTWLLAVQELEVPEVTADLPLGPDVSATERYDPHNIWLMTDPVAKARYEADGRLEELEHDIRFEVMRGQPFTLNDLAFARQLDWLEQHKIVKRLASYWATSPHPPIFKAKQAGRIRLHDHSVEFERGDQITWLCQMGKEMFGQDSCALIGDLQTERVRQLCGDMHNAMMGQKMAM